MIHPTKIFGHNEQFKVLNDSYHSKFPHAWIFNGIKGVGKYSTAINFIKSIIKKERGYNQNLFEINSLNQRYALNHLLLNKLLKNYILDL